MAVCVFLLLFLQCVYSLPLPQGIMGNVVDSESEEIMPLLRSLLSQVQISRPNPGVPVTQQIPLPQGIMGNVVVNSQSEEMMPLLRSLLSQVQVQMSRSPSPGEHPGVSGSQQVPVRVFVVPVSDAGFYAELPAGNPGVPLLGPSPFLPPFPASSPASFNSGAGLPPSFPNAGFPLADPTPLMPHLLHPQWAGLPPLAPPLIPPPGSPFPSMTNPFPASFPGSQPITIDLQEFPRQQGSTPGNQPIMIDLQELPRQQGSTPGNQPIMIDLQELPRQQGSTPGNQPIIFNLQEFLQQQCSTPGNQPIMIDLQDFPRQQGVAPGDQIVGMIPPLFTSAQGSPYLPPHMPTVQFQQAPDSDTPPEPANQETDLTPDPAQEFLPYN